MSFESITVVAAVNSHEILRSNLLLSPLLAPGHRHQLLIREGFRSAGMAYNDALESAENDIVVFVHQDVYLPDHWLDDLKRTVAALAAKDRVWGVIGCFGSRAGAPGGLGSVYSTGWGMQGNRIAQPEPVETLDEIVLVIRKSSGLRFDASLPHYHMYGVDLCLAARARGMEIYTMPTVCVHNTRQLLNLPPEFYACYRYVKRKWSHCLPIHTSCIRISRFDGHLLRKKLEALAARLKGRRATGAERLRDPRSVLHASSQHALTEV
jgi:Glycosyltransferase like family